MIEAVLFDFGGVFTPSPFDVVRAEAVELGIDPEVAVAVCFGPYDEDGEHPWHRLERGEVGLHEADRLLKELAAEHGQDFDPLAALVKIGADDPDREMLIARVRELRADGYRTALVTNNIAEFGDGWRSLIPVDELFELVVDSSSVGIRKPDPRIYQLTLERLNVPAERSVFLDDHPGNLRAAEALGMRTVLVGPDRKQAIAELDALVAG